MVVGATGPVRDLEPPAAIILFERVLKARSVFIWVCDPLPAGSKLVRCDGSSHDLYDNNRFVFSVSLRLPAPEAASVSPEYEPIYLNDTCEYNSAVSRSTQLSNLPDKQVRLHSPQCCF